MQAMHIYFPDHLKNSAGRGFFLFAAMDERLSGRLISLKLADSTSSWPIRHLAGQLGLAAFV